MYGIIVFEMIILFGILLLLLLVVVSFPISWRSPLERERFVGVGVGVETSKG